MVKYKIRADLNNGMTIEEACQKYHLTFKSLVEVMKGDNYSKLRCPTTGELYISHVGDRYIIRKNQKYYGSYETLEDAVKVRDYLIYNGWYKNRLNRICRELGVRRIGE